ncbi:CBS domain-containing protein [Streptomyces sp. AM8-1-1]|uniref:CBS domain-containing protein n=1 Tax=Streptomyces sp. AM8-1-1 TaxID=3075825 RepID=UPI0028C4ACAD|nr:CBS domain-containing protein [Streptomyces sp. AM8-1-1]WNO70286.1 CBS domain-containing protein [Streptomyces sp. AM8-1-1]
MNRSPYFVSDVMSCPVVAVDQDAPFKEIVETMARWKISALPVLDEEHRVVGVVSAADLLPKEEFRGSVPTRLEQMHRLTDLAKAASTTAGQLMTRPAITVPGEAPLAHAARKMAVDRVKRLPVVDAAGRLHGVVSRSDLLKVFLRPDDDLAAEVRRDVVQRLFPGERVDVRVHGGVVTLSGSPADTRLVPLAGSLVRAVAGVVDVVWDRSGGNETAGEGTSTAEAS